MLRLVVSSRPFHSTRPSCLSTITRATTTSTGAASSTTRRRLLHLSSTVQNGRTPRLRKLLLGRFGSGASSSSSSSSTRSADEADALASQPFLDVLRRRSRSWTPLLFALVGGAGFYVWCADKTNRESWRWYQLVRKRSVMQVPGAMPITSRDLLLAVVRARRDRLLARLEQVKEATSTWSKASALRVQQAFVIGANSLLSIPESQRAAYTLIAINAVVWMAWKVPRLQGFMGRHFVHDPLSGRSHTLLTSVFSHQSFWHLAFNSIALSSFGAAFDSADAQRPSTKHDLHASNQWHFFGFYVGAGLFASTMSHLVATRFRLPRVLKQVTDVSRASSLNLAQAGLAPSLGASGAVYAVVAMAALALPETHVSIILLPFFHIPIQGAVLGLLTIDAVGALRGWRMFDHVAHLAGAGAGYLYFYHAPWEAVRRQLLQLRFSPPPPPSSSQA